ncbi:MAG: serine/threonine-protein kinase [Planctomycetota bacterium]
MTRSTRLTSDFSSFESLSNQAKLELNRCCDRLEAAWNDLDDVPFADWVASMRPIVSELRDVLPFELIATDLGHRLTRGLEVSASIYVDAFPELDEREVREWVADEMQSDTTESPADATMTELFAEGDLIGDYVIEAVVGSGGMGRVYRAKHKLMGRNVAIKIMHQTIADADLAQRRFAREIQSIASLSHPNIVTAFDARQFAGRACLVTEWIDGSDLSGIVKSDGPLSVSRALQVIKQAAEGLAYAHSMGIVHRDVKPANLILTPEGVIKLLDLGLAKFETLNQFPAGSHSDSLTAPNHFVGTAAFMSPEQARQAQHVDARADIYSLGCTLYFLLAGQPPYRGETTLDTILAHSSEEIPDINRCRTDEPVPKEVAALLGKLLQKSPGDRPETMQQVISLIKEIESPMRDFVADVTVRSLAGPRRRQSATRRRISATMMTGVAAVALIAFFVWWGKDEADDLTASISTGVRFDGVESFAQVATFDVEMGDQASIEVLVTPESGRLPANVVTWSGETILVLFINLDHKWGVAVLHDGNSYLELSNVLAVPGQRTLIGVRKAGYQTVLEIDGVEAETTRQEYPLIATKRTLCFGGMPKDLFPRDSGTRYFTGTIHGLRVSRNRSTLARRPENLFADSPFTDAFFPLDEASGKLATDRNDRWKATISRGTWVTPVQ